MLLAALVGCGGSCDDTCHAQNAQRALGTDVEEVVSEIALIEDPVLRTAVIMEAVRKGSLQVSPDQAIRLCGSAPNTATQTHCENRFLRPHLQADSANGRR